MTVLELEQETDFEAMARRVADCLIAEKSKILDTSEEEFILARKLVQEIMLDQYIVPNGDKVSPVEFKSLTYQFVITLSYCKLNDAHIFNLSKLETEEGSFPIVITSKHIENFTNGSVRNIPERDQYEKIRTIIKNFIMGKKRPRPDTPIEEESIPDYPVWWPNYDVLVKKSK